MLGREASEEDNVAVSISFDGRSLAHDHDAGRLPSRRTARRDPGGAHEELVIDLPRGEYHTRAAIDLTMPIGGFDFDVEPTCGLAAADGLIGYLDDPNTFYEPDRLRAQLLWFRAGFVEYRFLNCVPPGAPVMSLQLTAEVCSEAPLSDPDWPSDISVWVNGVHLGEWTAPGDFGGTRGRLTPGRWEEKDSQFGVLKRWRVTVTEPRSTASDSRM